MINSQRRYDIDWLRVIAITMLLLYHVAIGFQSWGLMVGFITNKQSWENLWIPMTLLNVWRIPLLFFVSGMGVYFAIQKRNWKQVFTERAKRIALPFIFGMLFIVPLHIVLLQSYYSWELSYTPNPSHLWFLGNILIYIFVLLPIFIYLKNNKNKYLLIKLRRLFANPLGLIIVVFFFIAEAMIIKPYPFEHYAMTAHGFFLGLLAFIFGFLFMYSGTAFWKMLINWRWVFFILALALYLIRTYLGQIPLYQLSAESCLWIFSIFAFGHKHLNQPSKTLSYFTQGAYPIYIIHMFFIYLASNMIFPLSIDVRFKFVLVLGITFIGSLGFYDLFIRRINFVRPLFGMKRINKTLI